MKYFPKALCNCLWMENYIVFCKIAAGENIAVQFARVSSKHTTTNDCIIYLCACMGKNQRVNPNAVAKKCQFRSFRFSDCLFPTP